MPRWDKLSVGHLVLDHGMTHDDRRNDGEGNDPVSIISALVSLKTLGERRDARSAMTQKHRQKPRGLVLVPQVPRQCIQHAEP